MLEDADSTVQHNPEINYEPIKSSRKIPKRIDSWYYLETIEGYREQIKYLREEIASQKVIIANLSAPSVEVRKDDATVRPSIPVGRRNSPRKLSEMEAKERKEYWEAEIKRREELIASEGNTYASEGKDKIPESH